MEISKVESISIDSNIIIVGLVSSYRIKSDSFATLSEAEREKEYLIGVIENIDLCLKCQQEDQIKH